MEKKLLYRYERENGGITVSTKRPSGTYNKRYRLIADEGKALTNDGVNFCSVVDVDNVDGWQEVDAPSDEGDLIEQSAETNTTTIS